MKTLIAITTGLCLFFLSSSCKKGKLAEEYFIFGTYYGFCAGNCSHLFLLQNNKLHADAMEMYDGSSTKFMTEKLDAAKRDLAKTLQSKVPEFLQNSSSQTFGCPDCRDQGGILIEIKQDKKVQTFKLDTDVSQLPVEVRDFATQVKELVAELEK